MTNVSIFLFNNATEQNIVDAKTLVKKKVKDQRKVDPKCHWIQDEFDLKLFSLVFFFFFFFVQLSYLF